MKFQINSDNLIHNYGSFKKEGLVTIELNQYDVSLNEETFEEIKTPTGLVPTDFQEKYKPLFYKFDGEKIVINENYVETTPPEPSEPSLTLEKLDKRIDETNMGLMEAYETTLSTQNDVNATLTGSIETYELVLAQAETIKNLEERIKELEK